MVYLDSNLFIGYLNEESITDHVEAIFENFDEPRVLMSSVITYGEVLGGQGSGSAANFLGQLPVRFIDVGIDIMTNAAELRRVHASLKLPDAIHLATALHAGCTELISQDKKVIAVASKYLKAYSL